jgi:hypothetical protein
MHSLLLLSALLATLATANPISNTKREINPNTVNILTAAELTTQRNALLLAQSESAREAILFPNPPKRLK